ncbi:MAG: N(4)-(beta-N-acetylglucosaminyl)-L-asparaginase [Bacteroidetes bacterium]|nr:N(4)-(beta-N-acetylglucosaminyl)-L-asparaginase [Bacteroidota bacterium]
MTKRRAFLKNTFLGGLGVVAASCKGMAKNHSVSSNPGDKPIVISTWNHGQVANNKSWEILRAGGSALDAVEAGVRLVESDPEGSSVGLGGLPDRDGNVTLDACIMNHKNECGGVAFLQNIEHPVSVARKVMEETPHVLLVGEGARQFAIQQGFKERSLLTKKSEQAWLAWKKESRYEPIINIENHDTIGSIALDKNGNLSGACTTSGLAYKMHGRVGDSPLIGSGLFVDNEVGAACATGLGEAIIRVAGSAIIVEMMRHGMSPQEACEEACKRVIQKHEDVSNLQVAFIALSKTGEYGTASLHKGFNMALRTDKLDTMQEAAFQLG